MVLSDTANLLSAVAGGAAPGLFAATVLESTSPIVFFPVMSAPMWAKPSVWRNVERIRSDGAAARARENRSRPRSTPPSDADARAVVARVRPGFGVSECFKVILERLPNLRPAADRKPELIVQPPLGRRCYTHLRSSSNRSASTSHVRDVSGLYRYESILGVEDRR